MSDKGNGGALSASVTVDDAAADHDEDRFIGTRHAFSNCMARTVAREIEDADVARFEDLGEFLATSSEPSDAARLVFIDPKCAANLLRLTADQLARFGTATRAVAYEDPSEISPIFARLRTDAQITGFLPMRVRLDIWLSIIRLLVSGGGYVPDELDRPLDGQPATEPADCLGSGRSRHADPARERGAPTRRPRHPEQEHRHDARSVRTHGETSHPSHHLETRRQQPDRGGGAFFRTGESLRGRQRGRRAPAAT